MLVAGCWLLVAGCWLLKYRLPPIASSSSHNQRPSMSVLFKHTRFALAACAVALIAACGGTGSTAVATAANDVTIVSSAANQAQMRAALAGASFDIPAGALDGSNSAFALTFSADGTTFAGDGGVDGTFDGVFTTGSCIFTVTVSRNPRVPVGKVFTASPCTFTLPTAGKSVGAPVSLLIQLGLLTRISAKNPLPYTIDSFGHIVNRLGATVATVALQVTGATGATR